MRKTNESSLQEVIEQLLDQYRLRDKLNEVRIRKAWDDTMGNAISNRTTDIRIKSETLYISVSSAPLREELQFQRTRILELMNKELGGGYLKQVVIQ
jgi:predicted nucleic acid-binding Zn ribbon protein